jgi:TRAP-type C4-dicarboxylate transport system substrate-binding protein
MKPNALLACLGVSLACATAAAQEIKWTVGWTNAVGSSYAETVKTVPARIEAATKGRLRIELYDTLVLGAEQAAAVRDGRLDGSFAINPWLSAEAPLINFGALPGLLTDDAVYQKLLDPLLRDVVAKVWATKYNARQLATGVFEEQCVVSKVPLHTVADFAGKKARVPNTETASLMVQIGAKPTPIPFGEITTALQRGIVDMVMTSVGTTYGLGFPSVAKHLSIWKIATIQTWSFVVNQTTWEKLPADLKPIVEAEFRRIENEHFARSAAFSKETIDKLVSAGMTVYVAPADELAKMFSAATVNSVYENWYALNDKAGTDGRSLVKKINELKARP